MIPTLRAFVVPALAISLVAGACTSSGGGGLSEEEATERVDAVVAAFETAADEDGFSEDTEDDDDASDLECEGFEAFNDEDDDAIAEAELVVTDGGEPEVTGVEGDTIHFEGGEVTGGVKVGVIGSDRLRDGLDTVLDDPDAFEDCIQSAFQESLVSQDNAALDDAELDVDVDVSEGDSGDQEVVINVDGVLSATSEGLNIEFAMNGELRLIRVDRSGLLVTSITIGDVSADSIQPAIDAAIEEFESQFG